MQEPATGREAKESHEEAKQLMSGQFFGGQPGGKDANNERVDEVEGLKGFGRIVGLHMFVKNIGVGCGLHLRCFGHFHLPILFA